MCNSIIINSIDVTDPNQSFMSQEWAKIQGHYGFIEQRRQQTNQLGGRNPGRGLG